MDATPLLVAGIAALGGMLTETVRALGSRIGKSRSTAEKAPSTAEKAPSTTIEDFVVPVTESHAQQTFSSLLAGAKAVRMAGWSLIHTIEETRRPLRDLVTSGATLRILLLDPESSAVAVLDRNVSELDWRIRKSNGFPPVTGASIASDGVRKTIGILADNGLLRTNSNDLVRLCTSLLPIGLLMVEGRDGSGWLSVQMYPLHPDMEFRHRLSFAVANRRSPLWQLLEEQFDAAWDDGNYSVSAAGVARETSADLPAGSPSPPPR